jgi:hypothetical protein
LSNKARRSTQEKKERVWAKTVQPAQTKTGRETAQASIFWHKQQLYFLQQDSNYGSCVKKSLKETDVGSLNDTFQF